MKKIRKLIILYCALTIGLFFIYILSPKYIGIYSILIACITMASSRGGVLLFLSFLNFSLGVAFNYFIQVDQKFYFYRSNGVTAAYLCLVSSCIFLFIAYFDALSSRKIKDGCLIDVKLPNVSGILFFPYVAVVICTIVFILKSESNLLKIGFDAYELQKYPFLEYFGLILMFMVEAAKKGGGKRIVFANIVGLAFILTCLITSYRMVAIISSLSLLFVAFNSKTISKFPIIILWLVAYTGLTYISYIRLGNFDITIDNIFGYVNGRLDNTFTGVIETGLIYTAIGKGQQFGENLLYLIGTILPVPNTFIPDNMLYTVDAYKRYYLPGGGLLAGFVIYFNYFLTIPIVYFIFIAFLKSKNNAIAGGMYLITFITVTRWWLYGPYVIFKFFGVFIFLCGINRIAKIIELRKSYKYHI